MTGYKFPVVAFFWGLGVVFSIILLYLHREIYFLRTENPKQGSLTCISSQFNINKGPLAFKSQRYRERLEF